MNMNEENALIARHWKVWLRSIPAKVILILMFMSFVAGTIVGFLFNIYK